MLFEDATIASTFIAQVIIIWKPNDVLLEITFRSDKLENDYHYSFSFERYDLLSRATHSVKTSHF